MSATGHAFSESRPPEDKQPQMSKDIAIVCLGRSLPGFVKPSLFMLVAVAMDEEDESLLGTLLGGPVCTTRGDRGHQVCLGRRGPAFGERC